MTPEAQRIGIAEACGWTNVKPVIVKNVAFQGDDRFCGITSDNGWIPDYLNDLNAMHEAEKVIPISKLGWYFEALTIVHKIPQGTLSDLTQHDTYHLVHSTAAQRAEAFLRTLGKWKE